MLMNLKQRKKIKKLQHIQVYFTGGLGECKIHRDHHPSMNILDKKQATQTCRTPGEAELIIVNYYSLTNTVFVYSVFLQSGDERVAMERRAREAAEERLRRVMQEAEAR